jgi:hypothetical protein
MGIGSRAALFEAVPNNLRRSKARNPRLQAGTPTTVRDYSGRAPVQLKPAGIRVDGAGSGSWHRDSCRGGTNIA